MTSLEILSKQDKLVRDIVTPYICSGAWFAHSEAVLLTLISSSDKKEREFGVERILERRGEKNFGDITVRPRRTPVIDLQGTSLINLISWKTDVHEPVFSARLSREEVKALINTPFSPPYYPSHTQSTERAVRQVRSFFET